jgi:hypothetical protein
LAVSSAHAPVYIAKPASNGAAKAPCVIVIHEITCHLDGSTAVCYLDGEDLNEWMVREGLPPGSPRGAPFSFAHNRPRHARPPPPWHAEPTRGRLMP